MKGTLMNRLVFSRNTISFIGKSILLGLLLGATAAAQLHFDRDQFQAELTKNLEEKVNTKLEEGIWDLINRGEEIADKQVYLRDQLQPLVDAGLIQNTDNITKQAYDLYLTYKDSPDRKQQLLD
ncbi:MAG: hypothetical protein P8078_07715, partial [bacterium]